MQKSITVLFSIFIFLLLLSTQSSAQQAGKQVPITTPTTLGAPNALLYLPWDYDISGKKYPLILFGHGSGESTMSNLDKQGLPGNIANGEPPYAIVNGDTVRFIVLSITGQTTLREKAMSDGARDLIKRGIRIDTNRIYITGLSAGARAAVNYIPFQKKDNLQPVSAAVPMSYPGSEWLINNNIDDFNVFSDNGVWAFSGKFDKRTPTSEYLIETINSHLPGTGRLTIYPNGHCCWMNYYDPSYKEKIHGKKMNIYEWMLQYSLDASAVEVPVNQAPVAHAGKDQTIQLPENSVRLDGTASSDPDGEINSYKWFQKSGPSQATIENTAKAKTKVSKLKEGVYVFSLEVTDDKGSTATAKTRVTVKNSSNKSPKANAGGYQTVSLSRNIIKLDGSYSYDPDGTISSYKWSQSEGPSEATFSSTAYATPSISNLVVGVYFFDLVVTNNEGGTAKGRTRVTVKSSGNKSPKADAGKYQTITLPQNSTKLNGSQSQDPDGSIASYKWSQSGGPSKARFNSTTEAIPTISNLVEGVYIFDLVVTDNNGSTDKGRTQVTVKNSDNKSPKANAGEYQTITLPQNSIKLDGSQSQDPDGSIASYKWSQSEGPSKARFNSTTEAIPTVSNLVEGVYIFDLVVTDNDGSTDKGRTQVTVEGSGNKPPKASAGGYQTIMLPQNSVKLNGSYSYDPDGNISAYRWSQKEGPSKARFSNAKHSSPTISDLVAGVYFFDLVVTDNKGSTAKGRTRVTVKSSGNESPKANAGEYKTISLPQNSTQLDGSQSQVPDGSIASYKWSQSEGSSKARFNSTTDATPTVSNLVAGVYIFDLVVTNNDGSTDKGRTQVIVEDSGNKPPKASAGGYQTIMLPQNSVKLNGSYSYDPDGTISSYKWIQSEGPSKARFSSTINTIPTISNLVAGVYVFDFKVTDNDGATATGRTQVTVFQSGSGTQYLRTNKLASQMSESMVNRAGQDGLVNEDTVPEQTFFNKFKMGAAKTDLDIYPNPVHSTLHVTFYKAVAGKTVFRIINIGGQVLKEFNYTESSGKVSKTLHLGTLAPGIYFLQLLENGRPMVTRKLVKY